MWGMDKSKSNETTKPNQTRGPNSLHTCKGARGLQSGKDNEPKPPPDPPQPRASQWRQSGRKFCSSFLLGFIYLLVFRLQVHLVQFFVPFWARFMFFFVFFLDSWNREYVAVSDSNGVSHLLIFCNTSVATTLLPSTFGKWSKITMYILRSGWL